MYMGGRRKTHTPTLASQADKHDLYEKAVQCSEFEIDWVEARFRALRNRPLRKLREDFCGTANAACEHVKRHPENTATGVDLDSKVLRWGRDNHVAALPADAQARIKLAQQDVKVEKTPDMDAVLAMNFSYWVFDTRDALREYFKAAYDNLADDGILFVDAFGGYEAFNDDQEEETEYDDFTYVWYLKRFNPVNNRCHYQIIFRFNDGSEINPAFEYVWRHWTLPEIRELLEEAGFKAVTVYMQGWDDEEDQPSNEFEPCEDADADAGWVAYLTAEK